MSDALTYNEACLVVDLVALYHANWDAGRCRKNCDCGRCEAFEKAGENRAAVFDSLSKKADAVSRKGNNE